MLDRPIRQTTSPPPPPRFPILLPPPPPPPPPPPVILHPQFMPSVRTTSNSAPRGQSCPATSKSRRSIYSTDHSRDDDPRSPGPSSKRSRTASASAPRRSRRPFTVFPSKRATRPSLSPSANCKHYCHAFLRHGRKCLSPCARRRPGHYHCRCVRHQRR